MRQRQTFAVNKALLKKCTRAFDKLLESDSAKKGILALKDENPQVFKLFKNWLYTGKPLAIRFLTFANINR